MVEVLVVFGNEVADHQVVDDVGSSLVVGHHSWRWMLDNLIFPADDESAVRVESYLQIEAFILHQPLRVVHKLHGSVEHCSFQGQSGEFDTLEESVLVLGVLWLLGVLVVSPGDHVHVSDLEEILLICLGIQTHDLLLDRVNESLRVEHAHQFLSRVGSVALLQECFKLVVAVNVLSLPCSDRTHHPRDFLSCSVKQPSVRDLVVEDGVDCFVQVCGHDDHSVNGHDNL